MSLIAAGGALLGLFTFYDAVTGDLVIMEPLRVPAAFESKGYTSEITTQRMLDEIARLNSFATTATQRKNYGDQALFDTIAKSDVSIAGIDLKAIRAAIQKATGREPQRISGEIAIVTVNGQEAYTVRLRSNPPRRLLVDITVPDDPIKVLERTALALLEQLDPVIASSVHRLRLDFASALRMVDAALANADPSDDKGALAQRSFIYAQQRRFAEAEADAVATESDGKPFGGKYTALTNLYRESERYADSFAAADKAIEMLPKDPQGYMLKARTHLAMKQNDEAIALLKQSSALAPWFWPNHAYMGIALSEKGEFERAKLAFGRSLALSPTTGFVHFSLAETETKLDNRTAALRAYREAHALTPLNTFYLIVLLETESREGNEIEVAELRSKLKDALAAGQVPERLRRRAENALKTTAAAR